MTLDFLRSQSPGEKASDREVFSGTSESLNWIKGNYLPCSILCFCLGRVRVLWSVLNLVCSYDLCRGLSLTILGLVGVCHLAVEQRNQPLTIRGSLTQVLREQ